MSSKKQKEKNNTKTFSIKRIFNSLKYSIDGLVYAYGNEQSLYMHAAGSVLTVIIAFGLQISFIQWAIIFLANMVVLAIELINTAIEATVDMVTKEFNPYAKIAKDCGSAAAFIAGVAYALICGFIFITRIIELWF